MNPQSHEIPNTIYDLEMHRWLGYGALGALVTGLLFAGGFALSLAGWEEEGLGVLEILNLASLLALGVVLVAYWKLSLQTNTLGLRQSALGLFGVTVILEMAGMNTTDGNRNWWNFVALIVLALATVILVIVIWNLRKIDTNEPAENADASPELQHEAFAAQKAGKLTAGKFNSPINGVLAAFTALALVLVRVLAKLAGRRLMKSMDVSVAEGLLFLVLLVLAVVFSAWFAVVKFRLAKVLGTLAALVGATELLAIILGGLALGAILVEIVPIFIQAGPDEHGADAAFEAVKAVWTPRLDTGALLVTAFWTCLTAGMFLNCRSRYTTTPK